MGIGFLGALQRYAVSSADGEAVTYEFARQPGDADAAKALREAHQRGETPSVSLPAKLFGKAAYSGHPMTAAHVLDGILGEVTRASASRRADRARTYRDQLVDGPRRGASVKCPLLDQRQRYVAFAGNGKAAGAGYYIVGRQRRGWLHKCGYDVPDGDTGLASLLRDFLRQVQHLQDALGLVAAALDPRAGAWYGLTELTAIARGSRPHERLDGLRLRFYGPEDYADRLRDHYAQRGGFSMIPGGHDKTQEGDWGGRDLKTCVEAVGLTQEEIAAACGVSQASVSQYLNGRRTWPAARAEVLDAMLRERSRLL